MTKEELQYNINLYAAEKHVSKESLIPIPKSQLLIGKKYKGICRNSYSAIWNGTDFEYDRWKFGIHYIDHINHYEDDDGYDLFVPFEE